MYTEKFFQLSVKVPETYYKQLQQLVEEGHYVNMADALRVALRDLLQFHFPTFSKTMTMSDPELIQEAAEIVRRNGSFAKHKIKRLLRKYGLQAQGKPFSDFIRFLRKNGVEVTL